jgi:hypothetical protein
MVSGLPRAGRGRHSALGGAGVSALGSARDDPARLGADRARTSRGRNSADAAGLGRPTGDRGSGGGPYYLALLAEACGKAGQAGEGLILLAEALAAFDNTGEGLYEAEVHRLKGELLLARSAASYTEAETCVLQALTIARRQQAKSLELCAAMSLSRLSTKCPKPAGSTLRTTWTATAPTGDHAQAVRGGRPVNAPLRATRHNATGSRR